jgi:hypothetical protein
LLADSYFRRTVLTSDSDKNNDEDGSNKKKSKNNGQSQWVQEIEQGNSCDKHSGQACLVLPSGAHHQLTMVDKNLLGMMMVQ